jgi:hypothetical protein
MGQSILLFKMNAVTIGKNKRTFIKFDGSSSRSSEDECGDVKLHNDV